MGKDGRQRARLQHDNTEGSDNHKHHNQRQRQPVQEIRNHHQNNHHHRQQEQQPPPSTNQEAVASLPQGPTLNNKRPHSKQQQWKPFNEASYQERLRHWTARELEMATRNAKRAEEHEQEILRRIAWAKADAKFHEEYDDNVSDGQFYSGGSLRIKRENFGMEKYLDSQDYFDEKKELSSLKSRLETGTETARVNGCSRQTTPSISPLSSQDESSRSSSYSSSSSDRSSGTQTETRRASRRTNRRTHRTNGKASRSTSSRTHRTSGKASRSTSSRTRRRTSGRTDRSTSSRTSTRSCSSTGSKTSKQTVSEASMRAGDHVTFSNCHSRNDRNVPSESTTSYDDTGESSLCTPSAEPRSRWRPSDNHRRPAVMVEITTMTADSTTFQSAWWW